MQQVFRDYILTNFPEIKEVYEYGVNARDCEKPCVIIQSMKDIDLTKSVGYSRIINMYVVYERTSFNALDDMCLRLIKSDSIDAEYNLIFKTITFNILALYQNKGEKTDTWLIALSEYLKGKLPNYNIYTDVWSYNFKTPCLLLRVSNTKQKRVNHSLISNKKTIVCHVVTDNETETYDTLEFISNEIANDYKIPYDYEDKRFMTLDDKADSPCLNINRYADPYIKGQLTIRLSRLTNVRRKKHTTINTIKSRHFDYYK